MRTADLPRDARTAEPTIYFYDGDCSLCHRSVRFSLSHDRDLESLRFAPLRSTTYASLHGAPAGADSVVILTPEGKTLTRSAAVIHMLRRCGRGWRAVGALLALVPGPMRDLVYDAVATVRHRLFARPEDACPVVEPELRRYFLD